MDCLASLIVVQIRCCGRWWWGKNAISFGEIIELFFATCVNLKVFPARVRYSNVYVTRGKNSTKSMCEEYECICNKYDQFV